jgi:hypothetical protein
LLAVLGLVLGAVVATWRISAVAAPFIKTAVGD